MPQLTVATCQFPVSADVGANLRQITRQMSVAADRGARVAHFPEGALSGYAGTDFEGFAGFDWNELRTATDIITGHARRLGLWARDGRAHRPGVGPAEHRPDTHLPGHHDADRDDHGPACNHVWISCPN